MKYQRRTDDDRIAELNAKIEGIRTRAVRKSARANPAVRQTTIALKAIEKALGAEPEANLRAALDTAANRMRAALEGVGASPPTVATPGPKRRARAKATMTT